MSSKKRRTPDQDPEPDPRFTRTPPRPPAVAAAVEDVPPTPARRSLPWWVWPVGFVVALLVALEVYGPALKGEFVFDDQYLPFMIPDMQVAPLAAWFGVRPLLMYTYWLNYNNSGLDPYPYHMVSLLLHVCSAMLVWMIVRRLLLMVGEKGALVEILSPVAAGLFLLHPVNTESVAYVASRSEAMSIFFFLAAYAIFVCRPGPVISWIRTLLVLAFFGLAAATKEHTVVLPVLLLMTDYFFTTPFRFQGIRGNLKLYIPIAVGGLLGGLAVWRVLSTAQTAGFRVKEFTWYQYLFTQFRVVWTYVRLYLLPVDLNGDYQYPVSHDLFEHLAIVGLVALLAVSWFAWKYRREYPLAAFGWFGFLILLAPTSSVVPIRDVIVERRIYLPFICLLLISVDFIRRWKPSPALLAAAGIVLLTTASYATTERNKIWSSNLIFWADVVTKSPGNPRAWFQLAYAQWQAGMCDKAVTSYQKVASLQKPDEMLLVDWGLALECAGKVDEAVAKLRAAHAIVPSALTQAQIGMIFGKNNRSEEAMQALAEAEKLDPRFDMTYVYRGNLYSARGDYATAAAWYRHALAINPRNEAARQQLPQMEAQLAAQAAQQPQQQPQAPKK